MLFRSHPQLKRFDEPLKGALSIITNNALTSAAWAQASLPTKDGGLGIRSLQSLAPSAFLALAESTGPLQSLILRHVSPPYDTHIQMALAA